MIKQYHPKMIQAEIFDHMLAAAHNFDLRVFQQPTGLISHPLLRQ
jgi:hypothetical protein